MSEVTVTRHGPEHAGSWRPVVGIVAIYTEGRPQPALPPQPVKSVLRLGRQEGVALRVDDPQLSREHAQIEPAEGGIVVTDLRSRNGTFVNGVRLGEGPVLAPVGASLRCGTTLFSVVEDVDAFLREPACTEPPLVGSARMGELRRLVATVAPFTHPVLVLGETGTGKERAAEALHGASGRTGAYIPVNCSAIPENLVESELFGHTRGAFSGSHEARTGLFREADGGSLFLDEIGDLPLAAQAKLLRVLETGEVRPVGQDRPRIVDVRVIAATNRNLEQMVEAGHFRLDLLHRLSMWKVVLPPLRERREDIPLLAEHFRGPGSPELAVEAMERLVLWSWPGNVRELRSAVITSAARASAAGSSQILSAHLPPGPASGTAAPAAAPSAPGQSLEPNQDAVFRARVETALRLRNGNVAQVARDLGCGRPWLYQELKRLDIDVNAFRKG